MSRGLRIKKSRSMLVSLYTLSGLAALGYLSILIASLFFLVDGLNLGRWGEVLPLFVSSLSFILIAMLLSLPFALALSFYIVAHINSPRANWIEYILRTIDQAPILVMGLFVLTFVKEGWFPLYLVCSFIAVSKLSYRWIKLSNQIPRIQIETAQSLGMNIWQILHQVYLKKFFKMYVGHYFAVACFLFGVVTPFLCLISYNSLNLSLFSVQLFREMGIGSVNLSLMVFLLLTVHCVRLWFDSKAFYQETEHG